MSHLRHARLWFPWLLLSIAGQGGLPAAELEEPAITPGDRQHWSFRPLLRPSLPAVEERRWAAHAIDRFVLAELERRGLRPAPPAAGRTLIRRVTLDLTGLPPTADQVARFLADTQPDAYQQLVDRLLASPAYGERWGQHWLDLARFAETDGFEHDKVRPGAWRYRDWVIQALNQDLPYDRFVQYQLAGDELWPGDEEAAVATAFCLCGPDMPDINSQEERRHNLLNEMTATVGAVLLGLQLGCAQCHDHKYDPISQADFYRLRALFEPGVRVQKNRSVDVLRETGEAPAASFLMIRGDWRRRGPTVQPGFPRIADPWDSRLPPPVATARTSRRRAALAAWIVRPDHPLTSRVIVNRLWQHHFGEGLSRTPSDFGLLGDEPQHRELLDWLATELVRRRWSLKGMHRLIVTSSTYRQSSRHGGGLDGAHSPAATARLDAWLARYPRRRLEAEVIRDVMLAAADVLDRKPGGPGVMPPLPAELRATLLRNQWQTTEQRAEHYRRSVYVFARRNLRYPMFDVFDRPDANASCARRVVSTTAIQSLQMLNSEFSLDVARRLAAAAIREAGPRAEDQVASAFLRVFGRGPSAAERQEALRFLRSQTAVIKEEGPAAVLQTRTASLPEAVDPAAAAALADFCLALFNSSEFVYVD